MTKFERWYKDNCIDNATIESFFAPKRNGKLFSERAQKTLKGAYDYAQKEAVNELKCCANCKNLSYDSICKKNKSPINNLRKGNGCGQWQSWEE